MTARQPVAAIDAALRLLGRRAYSRRELAERLSAKGYARPETDAVMTRLESWGYLDDRAVAKHMLDDCLTRRPRGRDLLAQELSARGIPAAVIHDVLTDYTPGAEEAAAKAVLARRGLVLPIRGEDRGKVWRTLARLGFAESTIERICSLSDP